MELRNTSDNKFEEISSEEFRVYVFPNKETVRIDNPQYLSVSKSGGHRILDASEISHYIPSGWLHLLWKAKPGLAHFVK